MSEYYYEQIKRNQQGIGHTQSGRCMCLLCMGNMYHPTDKNRWKYCDPKLVGFNIDETPEATISSGAIRTVEIVGMQHHPKQNYDPLAQSNTVNVAREVRIV